MPFRGARDVTIQLSSDNSVWSTVKEATLSDPRLRGCNVPIETLSITITSARYIRVIINTFYGLGGGLQYVGWNCMCIMRIKSCSLNKHIIFLY